MNDKSGQPPLAQSIGTSFTDNPNVQTADPRLLMCSQDQSAGDLQ
jgi:hypothetical protein